LEARRIEELGKKKSPNFLYLFFSVWPKILNIFISNLGYSQIWLNLPRDDHHFGCKQKKFPKENK
jgi:hypothetical protein